MATVTVLEKITHDYRLDLTQEEAQYLSALVGCIHIPSNNWHRLNSRIYKALEHAGLKAPYDWPNPILRISNDPTPT